MLVNVFRVHSHITNRRPFDPAEEHAGMRRHRAALTALVANIDSALSAAMDLAIERASRERIPARRHSSHVRCMKQRRRLAGA